MPGKTMLAKEIDVTKINYSELKSLDNGAKVAYVNYGEGSIQSIYLQTPEVTFPFDNQFFTEGKDSGKFSCKVSLKTDNPQVKEFVDKLIEMDVKIKEDAKKYSMPWFKKAKITDDVIEEKYTPIIRHYKDPDTGEKSDKYPPQMAFKVVQKNGVYQCKFFDESASKINVDNEDDENYQEVSNLLSKGSSVKLLLKCNGLWFSTVGFGCTWKAEQMKVKVPETLEEYAFRDEGDQFVESDSDGSNGSGEEEEEVVDDSE